MHNEGKSQKNQWTRRRVIQGLTAAGAATTVGMPGMSRLARAASTDDDLLSLVNIFWGTGGHGHTYPGATVPFGMVQLSPDTYNDDWDCARAITTPTTRSWASATRT